MESDGTTRQEPDADRRASRPAQRLELGNRDVESKRMRGEAVQRPPVTLREHVDRYLEVHAATRDPNTIRVLKERLRRPVSKYGDRQLREFERMSRELAEWQATLPERSRYGIMQALRQCLEAGVRWGDMERNPAKLSGPNPPLPPRGVQTFTLEEIGKVATELGRVYGPMIRFAAATGMRPEEWVALERRGRDEGIRQDVGIGARGSTLRFGARGARRRTSSARYAARVLRPAWSTRQPAELPSTRVASCARGRWRAGETHLRPTLDVRLAGARWGVSVFELARIMGTSVRMIERHYGTLLQGSGEAIRGKLDAYLGGLGQEEATESEAIEAP
jgi:integrase